MHILRKHSSVSNCLRVTLRNSSTGAGLTGLTHASSGLIVSTIADGEQTATAYTQAAGNLETITTLGTFAAPTTSKARFKEVDATNHPGLYEIQLADARFAVSGAKVLRICVSGAANLISKDIVVQLSGMDVDDATAGGLSNLNAAVSSRSSHAASDVATLILATPANKLATDGGGRVTVGALANNSLTAEAIATGALNGKGDWATTEPDNAAIDMIATGVAATFTAVGELATVIDGLSIPSAGDNATALLDAADAVETGVTPRGALRALLAALAGVANGGNSTSIELKNPAGTVTRVTLTVDADGNRSASSLNLT